LPLVSCGSSHGSPVTADSQTAFGVRMAARGLWSEAFFRFQQAQRLEGGNSPRLLNNLAVASEALGKFDQALDYYKQGLQQAPGDRELKANYDRFVSFYESFRARGDEKKAAGAAAPAATAPPADSGSGAPAPPAVPTPPQLPIGGTEPPSAGPGTGTPPVPPTVPEPQPTPPNTTADATLSTAPSHSNGVAADV
ncbi:MAG TPA: tetratricopeptide repeat protein, partial [Thermoanaerobaculia bacterium]|nr:tetratricopeptide repeat protein [Thermoanaerobaculia bacterium]